MPEPVLISSYARTPIGGLLGVLSDESAVALGSTAIAAAISRSGLDPAVPERVVMGCVLPAGLGQAPARQAGLRAGLPLSVGAITVNKMCGSGMQALMTAHDAIRAGSADIVVAGGMESMSNAPHLLPQLRKGRKFGGGTVLDGMALDGLEDAYAPGLPMGHFAEETARELRIGRGEQDAYALRSLERALEATRSGAFADEIAAVRASGREVAEDEQPAKARPERIPHLRPAFADGGSVTAASSASISDGAAALVVGSAKALLARDAPGMAQILAHSSHAHEPSRFTTAPLGAISRLLRELDWRADDVDLFEVNEAFAVVPLTVMREFGIGADRMNVRGGATALGHPIGASGARIVATLLSALRERNQRRGVAAICIGGGEATALAIETA